MLPSRHSSFNAEGVCEIHMRDVGYSNLVASKDSHLFVRPLTKNVSLHDFDSMAINFINLILKLNNTCNFSF